LVTQVAPSWNCSASPSPPTKETFQEAGRGPTRDRFTSHIVHVSKTKGKKVLTKACSAHYKYPRYTLLGYHAMRCPVPQRKDDERPRVSSVADTSLASEMFVGDATAISSSQLDRFPNLVKYKTVTGPSAAGPLNDGSNWVKGQTVKSTLAAHSWTYFGTLLPRDHLHSRDCS
jgi:hypothetical protein